MASELSAEAEAVSEHDTLKYSLLGPSLTKSGQDDVDQQKVSEVIYNASKGSKYFNNEEARDKNLTHKIERILEKKQQLERLDLALDRRKADECIAELELSRDLSQTIVHIDCDAFYAAVEELDRPELKELPFAVGGGVLTTCNYHARKFGCRSGMAGFVAKKLCPQLIFLPLNFDKYTMKAQEVREIIVDYDPRFESASIDEAYLNITKYCQKNDIDPEEAVEQLRREVREKTKVTISAGIAANAKLAKICSNKNKPNGQFRLESDRPTIMAFMRDLPTRKVNGIGRVFERELDAIGVKTCGDIYEYRQYLSKLFGEKAFVFLMQCYLGIGRTAVQPAEEYERKSVGTESTFHDMSNPIELRNKLRWTAEELEKDMLRTQCKGRTLCLKVKLHTYEVFTRQSVPPKSVYLADDLYKNSLPMLAKLEQEFPGMKLRLMGLRCTHLVSMKKPDTMTFFGFKKKVSTDSGDSEMSTADTAKRKADALDDDTGQWETWPDELLFEDAERQEREDDLKELESLSQEVDRRRHHGKEIVPNPRKVDTPEEEWWNCPICMRPQAASEKEFNDHIDLCLSRGTIRDAVQETAGTTSRDHTLAPPPAKKTRGKDKRSARGDPKQRRRYCTAIVDSALQSILTEFFKLPIPTSPRLGYPSIKRVVITSSIAATLSTLDVANIIVGIAKSWRLLVDSASLAKGTKLDDAKYIVKKSFKDAVKEGKLRLGGGVGIAVLLVESRETVEMFGELSDYETVLKQLVSQYLELLGGT